LINYFW